MDKPSDHAGHFHAVRFYENKESLVRIIAEFLGEGILLGQPSLVIATPEHRDGIVAELSHRHFDVEAAKLSGALVLLDARDMLDAFMRNGMPDAERFREVASIALEQVSRGGADYTRAYGEMVDLLWKENQSVAAVRLEMLWNQLAMTHHFKLLCGYSMGNFYKDASIAQICDQHSHVIAADGTLRPSRRDQPPSTTIN